MYPLCKLCRGKVISGGGKGPCVIPGLGGRGWCWQTCTEEGGTFLPKAADEQQTGLEKSGKGKKLGFSAVDVYGRASRAHIYGSTNSLLGSDAAINISSSPKFGLALRALCRAWPEMCSKCIHVPELKEQHFPPASGAARASSSFIRSGHISLLKNKNPNSPWLTRK